MENFTEKSSLLIGCGYLGRHILTALEDSNVLVYRTARTQAGISYLGTDMGRATLLDINDSGSWENLDKWLGQVGQVYFLLPPSQIHLPKLAGFIKHISGYGFERLVVSSSTVVYGDKSGTVGPDSKVISDSERARKQLQIEELFLGSDMDAKIVRSAGLYGPGRVIGQQSLMKGKPISGHKDSLLNLIYVEDAAELLIKVMFSAQAGSIELGSDGVALRREDYYTYLATILKCTEPVFPVSGSVPVRKRICDINPTKARTAWTPRHTDFRKVLQACVKAG